MQYSCKDIWKISLPLILSMTAENLVGLSDTIFLGWLNETALAAGGLGAIYFLAIFVVGIGFSVGSQILIALKNGEKCYKEIGAIFYSAIFFLVILAIIIVAATYTFAPTALGLAISAPDVLKDTTTFLQWRMPSLFFIFAILTMRSFLVGTTRTKALVYSSAITVTTNIVFAYLLIFGKFGFPRMEIAGAALAATIAEFAGMLFLICYILKKVDLKFYALNKPLSANFKISKRILGISIYSMMQYFLSVSMWFIFFLAIGKIGTDALAASNIVRNVAGIVFMPSFAFAITASTVSGNLKGAKKEREIMPTILRIIKIGCFIIAPIIALLAIFPTEILSIYTNSAHIVEISKSPLLVIVFACVLVLPANAYFNVISGIGDTKSAFFLELASLTFYAAFVYVAVYELQSSLAICWCTEILYWTCMLTGSLLYLKHRKF